MLARASYKQGFFSLYLGVNTHNYVNIQFEDPVICVCPGKKKKPSFHVNRKACVKVEVKSGEINSKDIRYGIVLWKLERCPNRHISANKTSKSNIWIGYFNKISLAYADAIHSGFP